MSKFTDIEDEVQWLLRQQALSSARYAAKIKAARARNTRCTHKYREDYKWEHDNGYGRQTMITGERCLSCDARNAWKEPFAPSWSRPEGLEPGQLRARSGTRRAEGTEEGP